MIKKGKNCLIIISSGGWQLPFSTEIPFSLADHEFFDFLHGFSDIPTEFLRVLKIKLLIQVRVNIIVLNLAKGSNFLSLVFSDTRISHSFSV